MSFSSQKGEFDRFFNRLDRLVEESLPDRKPDRQPDRFPSLVPIQAPKTLLQKVRETRYTYVTLNFISISNTIDSALPIGRQSNHIWLFNNSAQVNFKIN